MFEAAFIYVFPEADPKIQRAEIPTKDVMNITIIGCSTYEQAEEAAKEMVEKGCTAIELCAGFGNDGIARIQKVVGPDVAVGAVKFDFHPAFDYKSGDTMF